MLAPWKESYDKSRQHTKKQGHHFTNKGLYSQAYGFSTSHIWMWELDHKEGWVPKNWCFSTVVLERTLQSSLDWKEIKPFNPKGNQPWILIGSEVKSLSRVWLFATPWIVAYQAPQSMEFFRQDYWSGLPFPSPGNLPDPGIEPGSPALQADALPSEPPGSPFIGRAKAKTETPIPWPLDVKNWLIGKDPDAGKDWGQKEKRGTEDEMVGWHHQPNGHEFEQTPRERAGQRSLACCNPWGYKESDTT